MLADVFEKKIRNKSLKNNGLYLSHYLSAPGWSWDSILNKTEVELELISDLGMYLYLEKGMKGRVSYIFKRCSKASNKYLKYYDPKQELKHIIYLGANNSYGYTMFKFLSTNGFKWIVPKKFDLPVIVGKFVF